MADVGPIIRIVLVNLAKKEVDRLPSTLLQKANYVAKVQARRAMLDGATAAKGNCLSSDGTIKFHKKYQAFEITTTSGKQLSIGLKDMVGGVAAEAMESFQHTIADLAVTLGIRYETNRKKLIASIKNTISDQCSVNGVFNCKLNVVRKNCCLK